MSLESGFGKIPAEKPKKKKIELGPGREILVSQSEEEEHKKLEARQSLMHPEAQEAEESAGGRTLDELTDEERELLAEVVTNEKSRANLSPENIEFLLRTKKEEQEKREAA